MVFQLHGPWYPGRPMTVQFMTPGGGGGGGDDAAPVGVKQRVGTRSW